MTSIGMSTFSKFLPPIEKEFGLSRNLGQLSLTYGILGMAMGASLMFDRIGS